MSWASSEVKPTVSTVLVGGEISSPPAWDRRSLLTGSSLLAGSSGGGPATPRVSGSHTLPGHRGAKKVVEPGPGELSPGLPGAEWSREMHTDEASATSAPSHPVQEELDAWGRIRVDSETSLKKQTDPLVPGRTPSISTPPPRGGASIPRASAPVSIGCLLLYCGPLGCKQLAEITTSLGITGGFGTPVCKWMWLQTPLVINVGDHRCVVWVDEHMVAPEIC